MDLTQDFKELLALLNEREVRYLVVGGYAVNHYGYPRYTSDIDLWIWMDEGNASRVAESLWKFGFSSTNIIAEDFLKKNQVIQLGYPPHRIDLMTSADGLDFEEAYERHNLVKIEDIRFPVISLKDLIINKKTTARLQDLADAEKLEKIEKKRKNIDSKD